MHVMYLRLKWEGDRSTPNVFLIHHALFTGCRLDCYLIHHRNALSLCAVYLQITDVLQITVIKILIEEWKSIKLHFELR